MRTILFALAAVAASTGLDIGAAQADAYPFCIMSGPGPGDCKYNTYGQCMATAAGTARYCQPNYGLLQSNAAMGYGYGYGYGRQVRPNRYYGPQY